MSETRAAKAIVQRTIVGEQQRLLDLSHRIHANPEVAFKESEAAGWLSNELRDAGFDVTEGCYDLPTAFDAAAGTGDVTIAICAEYDALPGIGHACGHNIIAAAAVGAAIGLRALGQTPFKLRIIGTPAEEAGEASGKTLLLERGAFEGVTASMMIHPAPFDVLMPVMIAAARFEVEYEGKESHAAFYPELGVNAADALVVAQVAIGLLRQHILPTDRIHGITTAAGSAPNIVPAHSSASYMVRSRRLEQLEQIRERVLECFRAGATATGARLDIHGGERPYADVRHNAGLARLYEENARALGRTFLSGDAVERPSGSTDMGNVSLKVPSIHPFIGIDSWPSVNHQPEFAAHCVSPAADRAVVDGAVAMAWTALDLATDRSVLEVESSGL